MNNRKIRNEEFRSYIKPKPNKQILGVKLYLHIYNLSNKNKSNWINRSLRTIGEEPVIYDEYQTEKTRKQLELYLKNKGYYDARVLDTVKQVKKNKRKVVIVYEVQENVPYLINSLNYTVEDSSLAGFILSDTTQSLIKRGDVLDIDVLTAEFGRIETGLKNRGYYKFTKEQFLYSEADSSGKDNLVDLNIVVRNYQEADPEGYVQIKPHPRYRIGEVNITTDFKPGIQVSDSSLLVELSDTLKKDRMNIIYSDHLAINPDVVINSTFLLPGDYFNQENVNLSYRHLSSLEVFRSVNIGFTESPSQTENAERVINCNIQLTPFLSQSVTVEPEITNSAGNIGVRGNLIYQHRNLFGGAENFDFRIKGGIERLKETDNSDVGRMIDLGAESNIRIPKFLLPFRTDQFIRKYNPKTSFRLAYNYQRRPEYTRTIANVSFGYIWRGNGYVTHNINPLEVNFVRTPQMSQDFSEWLEGKYIAYSYEPSLVTLSSYNLVFNNQRVQSPRDFMYIRYTVELAGNLLYLFYDMTNQPKKDGVYELFNIPFAQYVRTDIDLRYYNIINQKNSVVYRFFAGAGLPYINSTALPYEKKYFSGGANSIRAWQVRNLGPGSYIETNPGTYPNITADIKLEANLEYRFNLFWVMRGALFIDVGNIWAITSKDEREGALFQFNKFYKDLAVGTGFGTRLDFSFFLFRLDLGIKIKDPTYPEGERWFLKDRELMWEDFVLNFGIGYPF